MGFSNGNTLTHLYRTTHYCRNGAELCAEDFFKWFGNKLPDTYEFLGYDLVKVEEV